jgi:hypothetical protein
MNGYENGDRNPFGDLIALGVGVGAIVVTGVGAWKRQQQRRRLKGRTLMVCGRPAVGKTTLCTFLAEGRLPAKTLPTMQTVNYVPHQLFKLPGGGWIQTIVEPPSRLDKLEYWKRRLPDAGHVLYMFRADKVLDGQDSELKEIVIDAEILADFLKAIPNARDINVATPPGVLLVGTHSDYISKPNLTTSDEVADRIAGNPSIRLARMHLGGIGRAHLAVGSLVDEEAAGQLASAIVDKVVGK